MTLKGPGAPQGMAFMIKKKKYKFTVDFHLEELVEVPFVNAVLFAKIRLLEGGSFQEHSNREEVKNHTVKWGQKFEFPCKMSANASTGVLDPCTLRISVRKEIKGGRSYQKLGFIDLNLAEFAGSGLTPRRCLLEGYDARHRQDNSMLRIAIRMHMISGDILFKVPSPSLKNKQMSQDDLGTVVGVQPVATPVPNPAAANRVSIKDDASIASESSGFGSLTKKKIPFDYQQSIELDPLSFVSSIVTDSGVCDSLVSESTEQPSSILDTVNTQNGIQSSIEMGHSRNSSNTSQMSKGSGYSSFSHSQHSRQSSEGDSGHQRNPSSGSIQMSETGSLDRMKSAAERRKKGALETDLPTVSSRVEDTRPDTETLIDELLKNTKLEQLTNESGSTGLALFIGSDGTATLGSHEVKPRMQTGMFKQVVMENPR